MERLTIKAFRRTSGFIQVDEAYYFASERGELPNHVWLEQLFTGYRKADRRNITIPREPTRISFFARGEMSTLAHAYAHDYRNGGNLDWFEVLPLRLRHEIAELAVSLHIVDNPTIHPNFNMSGFGAVIDHDTLVGDAEDVFSLHRLGQVRQLGFLRHPAPKEKHGVNNASSLLFPHTRIQHSEMVYLPMNLIIRNNPQLQPRKNLLKTAALAHDGKTPAGGDTVKLTDLAWFDEETRFGDYGNDPMVLAYCKQYGIEFEDLWRTVRGEGLEGQVLDIADKLGYIAPDIYKYLLGHSPENPTEAEKLVIELLQREPRPCGIWEDFRVENGCAYFDLHPGNVSRYASFWLLRAYAFKHLYYHPYARLPDYLIVMETVRYLLATGTLKREKLLQVTDPLLDEFLWKHIHFREPFSPFDVIDTLHHRSKEEAAARAKAVHENGSGLLALVDHFRVTTKVGCDKFLIRFGGKFMSFGEVFPRELELITELMTFPERHDVHILRPEKGLPKQQVQNVRDALIHATSV